MLSFGRKRPWKIIIVIAGSVSKVIVLLEREKEITRHQWILLLLLHNVIIDGTSLFCLYNFGTLTINLPKWLNHTEFKRHKSATPEQTVAFMEAWAVSFLYYCCLALHNILPFFTEIRSHDLETDQCQGTSEKCCDWSRSGRKRSGRLQW